MSQFVSEVSIGQWNLLVILGKAFLLRDHRLLFESLMLQRLPGLNNIQMIFVGNITLRIIIGHNYDLAVTAPSLAAPEGLTRRPDHLGEGTWKSDQENILLAECFLDIFLLA